MSANVVVTDAVEGGAVLLLANRFFFPPASSTDAPVFDLDGMTPLEGARYRAQLYEGPALTFLRPVGQPVPFLSGATAGFFDRESITLPNVPVGGKVFAQVRVWDSEIGTSYEEARALGGKFGRSDIFELTTGNSFPGYEFLWGLNSFSLQAGLPQFNVGVIEFLTRNPDGGLTWSLRGEIGFRYLVEKSIPSVEMQWQPLLVLTNVSGSVTFTDTAGTDPGSVLYRARIID